MIRPLFSFFGAKWRLAPKYPPPAHRTIVEPFAGSAGYSCRYPDRRVILVERDPVIAALWRWLIRVPQREVLALPMLGPGQTVPTDLCDEARSLIGFWCNKGCSAPRRRVSGWGARYPRKVWNPLLRERVASGVARIRHWTVIEGEYDEAPDVRATWFIDPPYVGRSIGDGRPAGDLYRFGARRIDYDRLGRWARRRHGLVIACEAAGAAWLPFRPFAHARATPRTYGVGRISEEAVWISSEHGVQLPLPEVA